MTNNIAGIMYRSFHLLPAIVLLLSCTNEGTVKKKPVVHDVASASERALMLLETTQKQVDGAYVWSDSVPGLGRYKITRIKDDGLYKYWVWDMSAARPVAVVEDSIPVVDYISDSLYDVNGDSTRDFIINGQYRNGQCAPRFAILYCYDKSTDAFKYIKPLEDIPNPEFHPAEKTITAEIRCMMIRDQYKFRWNGLQLDTVYSKTDTLH